MNKSIHFVARPRVFTRLIHVSRTAAAIIAITFISCSNGATKDENFQPCDGPSPLETNAGWVHGRVIAAENDSAIKDAAIRMDGIDGCVSTDAEGRFAFPVAEGGRYGLTATAAGRTHARRVGTVIAGHDTNVGTLVLPELDAAVSLIGPEGGRHRSAAGGLEIDFPKGALDDVRKVRATRFNAGRELPGKLPEMSHFTMALNATAGDGSLASPATITIPNDYAFPPGTQVPVGVFDEESGEWVPDGMGVISDDGSKVVYQASHFSSFDCNYPVTSKAKPGMNGKNPRRKRDDCDRNSTSGNSLIDIRSGELRLDFDMPVSRRGGLERKVGLVYQSNAATPMVWTGGAWEDLADDSEDTEYAAIEVQVEGVSEKRYVKANTDENWAAFMWDGKNGRGETVGTGLYDGWIRVYNARQGIFAQADVFGGQPTYSLGVEAEEMVEADTTITTRFQFINGSESPVGKGWYLKGVRRIHQHRDGSLMVVAEGESGGVFMPDVKAEIIAGGDEDTDCGDGAPMQNQCYRYPRDLAVSPDGSLLTTDDWYNRIIRILPDGTIKTEFEGDAGGFDFGPLAVAPDGSVWFGDRSSGKIYRLNDGNAEFMLGGDMPDLFMNTPSVSNPTDLDFDADGNLYVADWPLGLRRYTTEGVLENVYQGDNPDIPVPGTIDVVADGSILLAEPMRHRVRRLTPDQRIEPIAGIDGESGFSGDGWMAVRAKLNTPNGVVQGQDGTIYISDMYNQRVRAVSPDGQIRTFSGRGMQSGAGWGSGYPATETLLGEGMSPVFDNDGNMLLLDHRNGWIWKYDMGSTVYSKPSDNAETIVRDAVSGTWTMTTDDGRHTFDSDGLMTGFTGLDGQSMTISRDDSNRVTDMVWDDGDTVSITWDENGVSSITGPGGRQMQIIRDGPGKITRIVKPDATAVSILYDDLERVAGWTDADGRTASYKLDDFGRISQVTAPDGSIRKYVPMETLSLFNEVIQAGTGMTPDSPADAIGVPEAEYTDASGKTWKYRYDSIGEATRIDCPDGMVLEIGNHGCGMPSTVVIPGDWAMSAFYDEWGRLVVEGGARGNIEYRWAPDNGPLLGYSTPGGHGATFEYDEHDRLVGILAGGVTRWRYGYTDADRIAWIEDATGLRTEYEYDGYGNISRVNQSGIDTAIFERNDLGEITAFTDAAGGRTEFSLDSLGRVTAVTDRSGAQHNIARDGQGQVVSFSTQASDINDDLITTWGRDASGRVSSVSILGAPEWSLEMDGENRVTAIISPTGRVDATYDDRGRVTTRTISSDGSTEPDSLARFEYSADGMLISAIDDDTSITWEYDSLYGNLKKVTQHFQGMPEPITLIYETDMDGYVSSVEYPTLNGFEGGVYEYWWHAPTGMLEEIYTPDGTSIDLYRDDAGRLTEYEIDWGDLFELAVTRDEFGFISDITTWVDSWREDVHMNLSYTSDDDGAIFTETGPSGTTQFGYDAMRRVTSAENETTARVESWNYNSRGEPTGAGFACDDAGRLVSARQFDYEYDSAGRVVSRTDTTDSSRLELAWDGDDNIVAARTYNSGSSTPVHEVTYGYDALGRRVWREQDGVRVFFIHDFADVVLELDESGSAKAFYMHDPGLDSPLWMERDGERYAFIRDAIGSVRGAVRLSDRTLAATREYSIFGQVVESTGTIDFRYGFHSRETDPVTGLIHFRSRDLDPVSGRFLSTDPEKFTSFMNTYAFPGNDPVNRDDPTGSGPRGVRAAGEAYTAYNKGKAMVEGGVQNAATKVAGRDVGNAAGYIWKNTGSGMIDTVSKVALPSPYVAPGPSVTDAAVYLYRAYKAGDPCGRAKVSGDILVDIMPAGDKWLRPMVDKFNNLGNLVNSGQ